MSVERNTIEWREFLVEEYLSGKPTTQIAAEQRCGASYPGLLAKRAGHPLRGGGDSWRVSVGGINPWGWKA